MKSLGAWFAFSLSATVLAGCLDLGGPTGFEPVELVQGAMVLDLPIHIVTVGFDGFQSEALLSKLRQPVPPYKLIRGDTSARIEPEPLQYSLQYMVHEAPDLFATALFDYAKTVATKAQPDAYLQNYDRAGAGRVCPKGGQTVPMTDVPLQAPPPCQDIERIDAIALEKWIAENRAAHGLEYGGAGYTVFLLDSYTKGYFPKESYHQYRIDDGSSDPNVWNQRAWGGAYDFVYLDVGAAPNPLDFRPWANHTRMGSKLTDLEDRPIWDHASDMGTFYENLARNVYDAARILWARPPIYPFEYAEKYVLPMYVFIDPLAHTNPDSPLYRIQPSDMEKNTDPEVIEKAFADLVPWAEVDLQLKFVYLPDDDQGLWMALQDAKHRFSDSSVDFGILKKYFRANWDKYVPNVPDARVYPTFAFSLEFPSASLFAYSDGDEKGNSWGVFFNAADMFLCPTRIGHHVCFTEDRFQDEKTWWAWWNAVLVHELGHSFGLTHTHDTGGLDEDGWTTYEINWLWDSTASAMTYRHSIPHFDQFDVDLLWRANAVTLAARVLDTDGTTEEARSLAERALAHVRDGQWEAGFDDARAAYKLSPSVSLLEDWGHAGTPEKHTLRLPGSYVPLGATPVRPVSQVPYTLPPLPGVKGVNYETFPLTIEKGARAVLIEFREADAPAHARQDASLFITNKEGDYVTGLWNNGHDKVFLLGIERCAGGCTVTLVANSGLNVAYDVTVTPYH